MTDITLAIIHALAALAGEVGPPYTAGYLSAYDQTPTDATLAYRIDAGQIPATHDYDVYLAVHDCWRVGDELTLTVAGESFDAIAFDCAGPSGDIWMHKHNIVAEVDWYFWQSRPELIGQWAVVEWN